MAIRTEKYSAFSSVVYVNSETYIQKNIEISTWKILPYCSFLISLEIQYC